MDYSWCGRSHAVVLSVVECSTINTQVQWVEEDTNNPELASLTRNNYILVTQTKASVFITTTNLLWDDEKEKLYFNRRRALILCYVFTKIESLNLSGVNELFHDIKDIHDLRLRVKKVQARDQTRVFESHWRQLLTIGSASEVLTVNQVAGAVEM